MDLKSCEILEPAALVRRLDEYVAVAVTEYCRRFWGTGLGDTLPAAPPRGRIRTRR